MAICTASMKMIGMCATTMTGALVPNSPRNTEATSPSEMAAARYQSKMYENCGRGVRSFVSEMELRDEDVEYGEWLGGHPYGTIYESGTTVRLLVNSKYVFRLQVADYSTQAAAREAAEKMRYEYSRARGIIRNCYRHARHKTTGQEWYEMKLTQGKTMLLSCDDLDKAKDLCWASRQRPCTYYAYACDPRSSRKSRGFPSLHYRLGNGGPSQLRRSPPVTNSSSH